jgi:hypothetical protein
MSEANNCVCVDMSDEWRGFARRDLDRRLNRPLDATRVEEELIRTSRRPGLDIKAHDLRTVSASGGSREVPRNRTRMTIPSQNTTSRSGFERPLIGEGMAT